MADDQNKPEEPQKQKSAMEIRVESRQAEAREKLQEYKKQKESLEGSRFSKEELSSIKRDLEYAKHVVALSEKDLYELKQRGRDLTSQLAKAVSIRTKTREEYSRIKDEMAKQRSEFFKRYETKAIEAGREGLSIEERENYAQEFKQTEGYKQLRQQKQAAFRAKVEARGQATRTFTERQEVYGAKAAKEAEVEQHTKTISNKQRLIEEEESKTQEEEKIKRGIERTQQLSKRLSAEAEAVKLEKTTTKTEKTERVERLTQREEERKQKEVERLIEREKKEEEKRIGTAIREASKAGTSGARGTNIIESRLDRDYIGAIAGRQAKSMGLGRRDERAYKESSIGLGVLNKEIKSLSDQIIKLSKSGGDYNSKLDELSKTTSKAKDLAKTKTDLEKKAIIDEESRAKRAKFMEGAGGIGSALLGGTKGIVQSMSNLAQVVGGNIERRYTIDVERKESQAGLIGHRFDLERRAASGSLSALAKLDLMGDVGKVKKVDEKTGEVETEAGKEAEGVVRAKRLTHQMVIAGMGVDALVDVAGGLGDVLGKAVGPNKLGAAAAGINTLTSAAKNAVDITAASQVGPGGIPITESFGSLSKTLGRKDVELKDLSKEDQRKVIRVVGDVPAANDEKAKFLYEEKIREKTREMALKGEVKTREGSFFEGVGQAATMGAETQKGIQEINKYQTANRVQESKERAFDQISGRVLQTAEDLLPGQLKMLRAGPASAREKERLEKTFLKQASNVKEMESLTLTPEELQNLTTQAIRGVGVKGERAMEISKFAKGAEVAGFGEATQTLSMMQSMRFAGGTGKDVDKEMAKLIGMSVSQGLDQLGFSTLVKATTETAEKTGALFGVTDTMNKLLGTKKPGEEITPMDIRSAQQITEIQRRTTAGTGAEGIAKIAGMVNIATDYLKEEEGRDVGTPEEKKLRAENRRDIIAPALQALTGFGIDEMKSVIEKPEKFAADMGYNEEQKTIIEDFLKSRGKELTKRTEGAQLTQTFAYAGGAGGELIKKRQAGIEIEKEELEKGLPSLTSAFMQQHGLEYNKLKSVQNLIRSIFQNEGEDPKKALEDLEKLGKDKTKPGKSGTIAETSAAGQAAIQAKDMSVYFNKHTEIFEKIMQRQKEYFDNLDQKLKAGEELTRTKAPDDHQIKKFSETMDKLVNDIAVKIDEMSNKIVENNKEALKDIQADLVSIEATGEVVVNGYTDRRSAKRQAIEMGAGSNPPAFNLMGNPTE